MPAGWTNQTRGEGICPQGGLLRSVPNLRLKTPVADSATWTPLSAGPISPDISRHPPYSPKATSLPKARQRLACLTEGGDPGRGGGL
eukprot:64664-Prorocentrum_minimum.AAC.1